MPISRHFRSLMLSVVPAAVLVSGCAEFSGQSGVPRTSEQYTAGPVSVPYAPPRAGGESGESFRVSGADVSAATQSVVAQLEAAGLTGLKVDSSSNTVSGSSSDPVFHDCGTLVIDGAEGKVAVPATSALAVLPAEREGPVDFVRRSFAGRTDFVVSLAPSSSGRSVNATVAENHRIEVKVVSADRRSTLNRESVAFAGNETGEFSSNMSCVSTEAVRRILR